MSRNTQVTPEEVNDPLLQAQLDKFWNFIEDKYEDEWRVEYSGAMVLLVDGPMLERILNDNPREAWYDFGAHKGGETAEGVKFFLSRPEYLKGLYSITGVYSDYQTLVDGPREYFFEQGY